jgi:methylated-DNA-[protein]-cysteine S-methyltransferase
MCEEAIEKQLRKLREEMGGHPPVDAVAGSRRRVDDWFARTAPLLQWDVIQTPLGPLVLVASHRGLRAVGFSNDPETFLGRLDPLARTEQSADTLAVMGKELGEYFAGARSDFDLPLDLGQVTAFRCAVLQVARTIPAGTVWTYGQVAQALGKPQASRAVGQALAHNPIPIVIPCHRVIAGDGGLGGYTGGLKNKRYLLNLEGAL